MHKRQDLEILIEFPTFFQTDHGNCEQRRGKANQEHHFNSKSNLKAEATRPTPLTKDHPACNKIQKIDILFYYLLQLGRLKTSSDFEPTSPLRGLTQELVATQRQVENYFGTPLKIEIFQNLKKEAGPKPDSGVSIFISRNLMDYCISSLNQFGKQKNEITP